MANRLTRSYSVLLGLRAPTAFGSQYPRTRWPDLGVGDARRVTMRTEWNPVQSLCSCKSLQSLLDSCDGTFKT